VQEQIDNHPYIVSDTGRPLLKILYGIKNIIGSEQVSEAKGDLSETEGDATEIRQNLGAAEAHKQTL